MSMHIATLAVVWLGAQAAAAPAPAPTDADLLRALHEKVMRAHQQSKVDLLLEDEAPDTLFVGRGDVTRPTLEERRTHLGSYLGRTAFSEYRDLVEPLVTVSADGSLGWVIVQVRANGIQTSEGGSKEPIQFVSAWIELYQKRAGRWYRVGNVSNFRP